MSKSPGRPRIGGWLTAFIVLPLGVWLAAAFRSDFRGKSVTNLSLEPLTVVLSSVVVFFAWFMVARRGLRPLVGIILLVVLSAAALAIHRFVPGLRE